MCVCVPLCVCVRGGGRNRSDDRMITTAFLSVKIRNVSAHFFIYVHVYVRISIKVYLNRRTEKHSIRGVPSENKTEIRSSGTHVSIYLNSINWLANPMSLPHSVLLKIKTTTHKTTTKRTLFNLSTQDKKQIFNECPLC